MTYGSSGDSELVAEIVSTADRLMRVDYDYDAAIRLLERLEPRPSLTPQQTAQVQCMLGKAYLNLGLANPGILGKARFYLAAAETNATTVAQRNEIFQARYELELIARNTQLADEYRRKINQ